MTMLAVDALIRDLQSRPEDFESSRNAIVETLKQECRLDRVVLMLYNKRVNMLESVSAAGVPNIDHHNIRAPVIRLPGISSRAVEARSFLENRAIVVRDRSQDPQYRLRSRFPHKLFSREFAVFPLVAGKRKLGILAVSVDEGNPTQLTARIARRIEEVSSAFARIIYRTIPRMPSDLSVIRAVNEIIDKGLITAAYQPIVNVVTKRIHGHEALMRVDHPLISGPEVMLGYAEKLNNMRDVSFQIHKRALKTLSILPKDQLLFINLHPKDFIEYENLDDTANPLHGVDLARIVLELTERHYLNHNDRVHSIIRFFKGLGARIALDDLGSGFSNLEMLTNLEPDYIKFDMSLTRNIHVNVRKQKLLRALLYYCDQIGCLAIAEGAEMREEYELLIELKCRLVQGFYMAHPSPAPLSNKELKKVMNAASRQSPGFRP